MDEKQLKKEIDEGWLQLERLRDEVRVKLHLGTMDVRDAFHSLDKEAHALGRTISQVTHTALKDLNERLQKIASAVT